MGYIYCLFDVKNKITRVGKTKNKDKSRQKMQLGYYPFPLLEWTFKMNDFGRVESEIHRELNRYKQNGDWYSLHITKILEHIILNYDWDELDSPSPITIMSAMERNLNSNIKM